MKTTADLVLTKVLPPIYMGCHRQAGHYFFTKGMRSLGGFAEERGLYALDTAFAPTDTQDQGLAWFHAGQSNGIPWNVISFWDRTIDRRPGSHSTFLLTGSFKFFSEAIVICRQDFPEVFERFNFEVKLVKNCFE